MVMAKRTSGQVRIADFKARLSEHLRLVRRGGTLTILDRDTPVARVVPYHEGEPLRVRPPAGQHRLRDVPLPPPVPLPFDIVTLLLEERQGER
jgi:prevent-host-death family protein